MHTHQGELFAGIEEMLPGVCIDFDNYIRCEQDRLTPLLEKSGVELVGSWFTGERDSFGPLSRAVRARKHGVEFVIVYG